MRSLAELQRGFAEGILAPDADAPAFVVGGTGDGAERFAIYRRAIFANYRNALGATYPVVRRIIGASTFNAAVDAYVRARPSTCGDLNDYGDTFAAFLAADPPAADLPYLPDVARLEWAIDEASRASEVRSTPDQVMAALSAVPAGELPAVRLELAPSCRLLTSAHPIFSIWKFNQPDRAGVDRVRPDASADTLLVRRDAEGIGIERLTAGEFAWLAALAGGAPLADAIEAASMAEPGFDLGPVLHSHVGASTIGSIVPDRCQDAAGTATNA
jgi:hypothetical protein